MDLLRFKSDIRLSVGEADHCSSNKHLLKKGVYLRYIEKILSYDKGVSSQQHR